MESHFTPAHTAPLSPTGSIAGLEILEYLVREAVMLTFEARTGAYQEEVGGGAGCIYGMLQAAASFVDGAGETQLFEELVPWRGPIVFSYPHRSGGT